MKCFGLRTFFIGIFVVFVSSVDFSSSCFTSPLNQSGRSVHFSGCLVLVGFIIFNMILVVVIFFWDCLEFVNPVPKAFRPHH